MSWFPPGETCTLRYPFDECSRDCCFLDLHLTAWRSRCAEEACIQAVFPNVSLAATVREGGQIDVRPDAAFVSHLVWVVIE